MSREEGLKILKENLSNQNLIKHSLAVEAIMRVLARRFNQDQEKWGLAGLLHDIDYEKVVNEAKASFPPFADARVKYDLSQHSLVGAEMLKDLGVDEDICRAVKVHNEAHGIVPQSAIEKALFVTDPLTGLIVAATLVLPSKKIKDLTVENVLNRYKEKAFARGANREIIGKCKELLDLELEEFIKIGLEAMQGVGDDLGL